MKILAAVATALAFAVLALLWRADVLSTRAEQAQQQVATLTNALESRKKTQALLTDLDTRHTEELAHAQKTNAQLRAAVATGQRRLSVAARCPVRAPSAAAGLDDAAARAELDSAAAERIVAISNDGDDAIRALTGLQEYVRRVCLKQE